MMAITSGFDRGIEQTLRNWRGAIRAKELSAVIDVAVPTIYRYAKTGVFPRLPLPGVVRFDPRRLHPSQGLPMPRLEVCRCKQALRH